MIMMIHPSCLLASSPNLIGSGWGLQGSVLQSSLLSLPRICMILDAIYVPNVTSKVPGCRISYIYICNISDLFIDLHNNYIILYMKWVYTISHFIPYIILKAILCLIMLINGCYWRGGLILNYEHQHGIYNYTCIILNFSNVLYMFVWRYRWDSFCRWWENVINLAYSLDKCYKKW